MAFCVNNVILSDNLCEFDNEKKEFFDVDNLCQFLVDTEAVVLERLFSLV